MKSATVLSVATIESLSIETIILLAATCTSPDEGTDRRTILSITASCCCRVRKLRESGDEWDYRIADEAEQLLLLADQVVAKTEADYVIPVLLDSTTTRQQHEAVIDKIVRRSVPSSGEVHVAASKMIVSMDSDSIVATDSTVADFIVLPLRAKQIRVVVVLSFSAMGWTDRWHAAGLAAFVGNDFTGGGITGSGWNRLAEKRDLDQSAESSKTWCQVRRDLETGGTGTPEAHRRRTLGRSLVALSIPESTRPQLYFLIATHAISLALVLASLLLRVRKPSFWLFRRHASSPLILPNFSILVAGAMIAIIPLFQVLFARILQSFERAVPPADLGYEVLFVGSAAWWICEIVTWSISASYLVNLSSQGREIYVYANLCNIVGIASPFVFLVGTVTYTVLGGHAYDRAVTIFAELDRILSQYEVQWMPGDDPATIPVPSVELSDAFAIQLERAASLFRQNFLFQAISACILWVILVGVAVPYLRSFRKTIVSQGRALQASGTVNAQCVKKRKQLHKTWLSLLLILTVFAVYCLVVCVLSFAIYLTPQNSKGSRKLAQAILFGPFTTTGVLGIPLGWVLLWKAYRHTPGLVRVSTSARQQLRAARPNMVTAALASSSSANAAPTHNGASISTSNKSRGQLKRLKKKQKGASKPSNGVEAAQPDERPIEKPAAPVEDITKQDIKLEDSADVPAGFEDVFKHFQVPDEAKSADTSAHITGDDKGEIIYSDDEQPSEDDEAEQYEVSKRKQRKMNRLTVAELKRLVSKPEVVEWVDVSAQDPRLLVMIKSHKNTVPIPQHWGQKRDYLAGKRGIEKAAFQLPSFIADTGIATQRDAIKEKEEGQSLKQKSRERVQPKMGKIDIDYQKLHDAFFKYQTKPKMTEFGELYYEGKEFETKLKEKKPGDLSPELKEALSIPPLAPPPWLISMQRYGPPPSYPNLRIPGLNAPIPEGAAWGFHPGGWGKPPLDEYGRPLYGDIYGVDADADGLQAGEPIEKEPWGELEPEVEESEEEEEDSDSESEGEEPVIGDGLATPATGLETPSGLNSVASTVPGGLETPDFLELRKRRETTSGAHDEDEEDAGPKELYQVLPEKESRMRGFMGSDRTYDVSALSRSGASGGAKAPVLGQEERGTKRKAGGVDIALDAADLEGLTENELRQKYEAAERGGRGGTHEDFSDFAASEVAKRRKMAESKKKEKEKEKFKF
ncbi:U2 snRNP complex subunit CUS1 [Sporobolomyces koalae]|uniref:U2 snRNP complex subunit CUS1 n=1 Tax=Sporobolomyces koalae TaxID=500713 RepID=UPI00316D96DB